MKGAEFDPDVVVALARGGWFAGRCICDFLGLDDLTSLKMEHYVGPASNGERQGAVRCPTRGRAKGVLGVVDDITAEFFRENAESGVTETPAASERRRSSYSRRATTNRTSSASRSKSGRGSSTPGTSSRT